MYLILYGDIFLHNIINYLDLKGLSKLKCVCKMYNHIITKTLVKQLTINKIKSELKRNFGDEYDKLKKKIGRLWKGEIRNNKYYVVKIDSTFGRFGRCRTGLFQGGNFCIGEKIYMMYYVAVNYIGSKHHALIHTIPSTLNISDLKNQIYNATDRIYFFLENDTDNPFEIGDHL
jgi:hypothetical protein